MNRRRKRFVALKPALTSDTWLLSLTDLVCVLLAFFVLRFAMSAPMSESWNSVLAVLGAEESGRPLALPQQLEFLDTEVAIPVGYLVNVLKMQLDLDAEPDIQIWRREHGVILAFAWTGARGSGGDVRGTALMPVLDALGDLMRRLRNGIEIVGVLPKQVPELDDPVLGVVAVLGEMEAIAERLRVRSGRQRIPVSVQLAPWAWQDDSGSGTHFSEEPGIGGADATMLPTDSPTVLIVISEAAVGQASGRP